MLVYLTNQKDVLKNASRARLKRLNDKVALAIDGVNLSLHYWSLLCLEDMSKAIIGIATIIFECRIYSSSLKQLMRRCRNNWVGGDDGISGGGSV